MQTRYKIILIALGIGVLASTGVAYSGKFPTLEESLKVVPTDKLSAPVPGNQIEPLNNKVPTSAESATAQAWFGNAQKSVGDTGVQKKKVDIVRAEEIYPTSANILIQKTEAVDSHVSTDASLRDVQFCGTSYKSKKVMIDGVDFIQRLADILPKSAPERGVQPKTTLDSVCWNIVVNTAMNIPYAPDEYSSVELPVSVAKFADVHSNTLYNVRIGVANFEIHRDTGDIYEVNEFGSTLIGNLKK